MKHFVDKLVKENPRFKHTACYTDSQEFNHEFLNNFVNVKNTDFYFCAPDREFGKIVSNVLRNSGVARSNTFFEFEGPYNF